MRIACARRSEQCDLRRVSDCIAHTDTTALAHVLLPAAAWGEKDGTVTNSERRISRQRAFLTAARGCRGRTGGSSRRSRSGWGSREASTMVRRREIFDEHARLSAAENDGTRGFDIGGLAGLTSANTRSSSPCSGLLPRSRIRSARSRIGYARLFEDGRFLHADGRARFVPTAPPSTAQAADEEFPFILNTGRIRDQWHTMTRTGRSPRLTGTCPSPSSIFTPRTRCGRPFVTASWRA